MQRPEGQSEPGTCTERAAAAAGTRLGKCCADRGGRCWAGPRWDGRLSRQGVGYEGVKG